MAPFFKEKPTAGISLQDSGSDIFELDMREEIEWPFIAAVVAGYRGPKPALGTFAVGNNFDLGLEFELNSDSEWEMLVTKRQDYEQQANRIYDFTIECDSVSKIFIVKVSNIFDNAPVMTAATNPCRIEVR